MEFQILRQLESEYKEFLNPLESYKQNLLAIRENLKGVAGENFVGNWLNAFSYTGSPVVVNLDHNVSSSKNLDEMVEGSRNAVDEMEQIVKATSGHMSGYKMNRQSMLTFLIAGEPYFVKDTRELFREECKNRFHVDADPVIWTDEKIGDIPSTAYQTARIIYNLGYDAVHCMPQIGPDVAGAVQLAAEEQGMKGVIHVVDMTHDGYSYVKEHYFKDGEKTVNLLRENALGNLETEVNIGRKEKSKVKIRATAAIEPANRPIEIFQSRKIYGNNLAIISIGIGKEQGAWPGSAIYAGADIEGVGRFVFKGTDGKLDNPENIAEKARACKMSALRALKARVERKPYPFDDVREELGKFVFPLREDTKEQLGIVYDKSLT